jgi:hypothetical protein
MGALHDYSRVGFPTLLPEPDGHLSMHPVLRLSNASGFLNHLEACGANNQSFTMHLFHKTLPWLIAKEFQPLYDKDFAIPFVFSWYFANFTDVLTNA